MDDFWRELANQLEARKVPGLLDFVPTVTPEFHSPRHLAPFATELEKALTQPVRLLCSTPPQHGKTELLLHFIVWALKNDPRLRFCYISYSNSLVQTKCLRAKDIAMRAGLELREKPSRVDEWMTPQGGGLVGRSIGGSITGLPFEIMIFDDPYASGVVADSDAERETVWRLFYEAAFTRKQSGGSFIINAARWRHDDLIGVCARDFGWPVIVLPIWNRETHVPLWPEKWKINAEIEIQELKKITPARTWEALFMGNPQETESSIFSRDWMTNRYKKAQLPPVEMRVMALDGAWEEGVSNDWSVISTWSRATLPMQLVSNDRLRVPLFPHQFAGQPALRYFLEDEWRARVQLPHLVQAVRAQAMKHQPHAILIEYAASGIGVYQMLKNDPLLSDRIIAVKPQGTTKTSRAEPISPLFATGSVWLPDESEAPWLGDWIEEHVRFPTGGHDDRVDCTSMALSRLSDPKFQPRRHQDAGNVARLAGMFGR